MKAPWQMTQREYILYRKPIDAEETRDQAPAYRKQLRESLERLAIKQHKMIIEEAVLESKPVPAEVLVDYWIGKVEGLNE